MADLSGGPRGGPAVRRRHLRVHHQGRHVDLPRCLAVGHLRRCRRGRSPHRRLRPGLVPRGRRSLQRLGDSRCGSHGGPRHRPGRLGRTPRRLVRRPRRCGHHPRTNGLHGVRLALPRHGRGDAGRGRPQRGAVDALRHASRRSARVGAEPWKLLADIELARLGAGTDDDRRAEAPEALAARADLLGLNWLAGQARALSPTVVS